MRAPMVPPLVRKSEAPTCGSFSPTHSKIAHDAAQSSGCNEGLRAVLFWRTTYARRARRTSLAQPAPQPLWIAGLAALRGVGVEGESGPQRSLPDPDAADPPFANDARQNGVKD